MPVTLLGHKASMHSSRHCQSGWTNVHAHQQWVWVHTASFSMAGKIQQFTFCPRDVVKWDVIMVLICVSWWPIRLTGILLTFMCCFPINEMPVPSFCLLSYIVLSSFSFRIIRILSICYMLVLCIFCLECFQWPVFILMESNLSIFFSCMVCAYVLFQKSCLSPRL